MDGEMRHVDDAGSLGEGRGRLAMLGWCCFVEEEEREESAGRGPGAVLAER